MRHRRFRFRPQMDTLSLRVVPSGTYGAEVDSGADCGDTADWNQDADTTDPGSDSSNYNDPSATDSAIDDCYGEPPTDSSDDPMAAEDPDGSVYTEATPVLPGTCY